MQNEDDEALAPAAEPTVEEPEAGVADGEALADDSSRAPEEESQSQLPGDPRAPHEMQPPTKEQY